MKGRILALFSVLLLVAFLPVVALWSSSHRWTESSVTLPQATT
jgi:hypothetical protein